MINLFHIPNYAVDTAQFTHILHGDIVDKFTENFCKYVGVQYGCPVNSATSAIFLISLYNQGLKFSIPTMIPPVVLNAVKNSKSDYELIDDTLWVGGPYIMYSSKSGDIIDSAQEVKRVNLREDDIIIYSFYPTKPVGSCDGGMICSNNKEIIDFYKLASNNGMEYSSNSWEQEVQFAGWKMYMNSVQAYIANENLKRLDDKKAKLRQVRDIYNSEFGYSNTSEHLYRINVKDNQEFVKYMKSNYVVCGIHYKCTHTNPVYGNGERLPNSEHAETTVISIPYHEKLTEKEILWIVKCVKLSGMMV